MRDDAIGHCFLDSLVNRRNISLGDSTPNNFILKNIAFPPLSRRDFYPSVSKLSFSTRLLFVFSLHLGGGFNCFAIRNLGSLDLHLYTKTPLQPFQRHIKVNLPQPGEQQLSGLSISFHLQARVLFQQSMQGTTDFFFVSPRFGYQCT